MADDTLFMPYPSASLLPSSTREFTAVLLAGGRSSRMGFDKATLVINGTPLWKHQLDTLRATLAAELLISGHPDGPYHDSNVPVIVDDLAGSGPLGGLAKVLRVAKHPLVLVLAIDMPAMTADCLKQLVAAGPAIPICSGKLEPLAATYPKAASPVAERLLAQGQHSMRAFTHELFDASLAKPLKLSASAAPLFRNLNTPEDLSETNSPLPRR